MSKTISSAVQPQALRALALLFDYPQPALQEHVDELAAALLPLAAPAEAKSLRDLLDHVRDADLLDLQADYVDTFDRGRSTALNLFEHVHGDSRDRGQAMVDLLAQYGTVGLELQSRQLPDYLPVYLEYCSVLDTGAANEALQEVALLLANLAAALERRESPWFAAAALLSRLAGLDDWRTALQREAEASAGRTPTPGPRDIQREGLPADWTPAALDAAWAEEPVNFLGACNPQHATEQTIQFVPRQAHAAIQGA